MVHLRYLVKMLLDITRRITLPFWRITQVVFLLTVGVILVGMSDKTDWQAVICRRIAIVYLICIHLFILISNDILF